MRLKRSRAALGVVSLAVVATMLTPGHGPATAATGAALADPAAGTVVYVKDWNVWIARPDGTGQRQLTTDGTYEWPYVSPSMADDGTIAVARRREIIRMRQGGTVLNRMDPRPLPNSAGIATDGTPQVAISPDGSRIAYQFAELSSGPGIPTEIRTVTAYTAADRLTDHTRDRLTYFKLPSWVGNDRTLQSGGASFEVMVHDLGSDAVHWFDSQDGLTDVELSPDGRRLAGAAGYQGDLGVSYFDVAGNAESGPVPAAPVQRCNFRDDAGPLVSPTWGPDSKALAFQSDDGIYVAADVTACEGSSFDLIVEGGSAPDWSPAAYDPEDPAPQVFSVTGKPRVVGQARVGRKVTVRLGQVSPRPTTTSYQWRSGGRAIPGATGPAYRIAARDRNKTLTVTVTLDRAGYASKVLTVRAGRV